MTTTETLTTSAELRLKFTAQPTGHGGTKGILSISMLVPALAEDQCAYLGEPHRIGVTWEDGSVSVEPIHRLKPGCQLLVDYLLCESIRRRDRPSTPFVCSVTSAELAKDVMELVVDSYKYKWGEKQSA